jgi:hypothetical protein
MVRDVALPVFGRRCPHVQGRRVYNYGHALAAERPEAEVVLTRNLDDFAGLTNKDRDAWQ